MTRLPLADAIARARAELQRAHQAALDWAELDTVMSLPHRLGPSLGAQERDARLPALLQRLSQDWPELTGQPADVLRAALGHLAQGQASAAQRLRDLADAQQAELLTNEVHAPTLADLHDLSHDHAHLQQDLAADRATLQALTLALAQLRALIPAARAVPGGPGQRDVHAAWQQALAALPGPLRPALPPAHQATLSDLLATVDRLAEEHTTLFERTRAPRQRLAELEAELTRRTG